MITSFGLASLWGYIGPGGGMALLGPLVAVAVSIFGALAMVAVWPIRRLWQRMKSSGSTGAE